MSRAHTAVRTAFASKGAALMAKLEQMQNPTWPAHGARELAIVDLYLWVAFRGNVPRLAVLA